MDILRVLVVDDELGMRLGVARALRDAKIVLPDLNTEVSFEVEQAQSGEEALEMIAKSRPDIMLLDHKMGGISGLEVLEKIEPTKEHMLTIMVTAYASLETAVIAIKQGAFDFLAKPFTPTELKATVRKAAETLVTARQVRKLAQEKRQVRFEFIRVLAHELKSPLAAVEGYLNIIQQRAAGNDLPAYDHVIERCLVRTAGMRKQIMDLLDLTRIESGQKKRELTAVVVNDIARRAIETFTPDAASRQITVAIHAEEPLEMKADAGELEIIFNNLISNAIKYNRDQGRVDVTLSRQDTKVVIEVADTGIGMTQEECSRLFRDFVRIKNAKTLNILGSGLGLSILQKLAQLYGGDASVRSAPDVGTTFTVVLEQHGPQ